MDAEKEINNLAAETLAIQALLVAVLSRLSSSDPSTNALIHSGFDAAASFLEDRTIETGEAVTPEHLAHSLRVIEELRAATFHDQHKPKHGV
jgi:hypothetical protein